MMTAPNLGVSDAVAANSDIHGEKSTSLALSMDLVGDEARSIDPEAARRVLRKIDLFLMPAMVLGVLQLSLFPSGRFEVNTNIQDTEWCTGTR